MCEVVPLPRMANPNLSEAGHVVEVAESDACEGRRRLQMEVQIAHWVDRQRSAITNGGANHALGG